MNAKKRQRLLQLLVAVGDENVERGHIVLALESYLTAVEHCPRDKIVRCGELLLSEGKLSWAIAAFRAVGEDGKLLACALQCLERCEYNLARLACAAASRPLPTENFRSCAARDFRERNYARAIQAYSVICDRDGLLLCGITCLRRGYAKEAISALRALNRRVPRMRLLDCARVAESKGWSHQVVAAYQEILSPGGKTFDLDYSL